MSALAQRWEELFDVRSEVQADLRGSVARSVIGAPLEADVTAIRSVQIPSDMYASLSST